MRRRLAALALAALLVPSLAVRAADSPPPDPYRIFALARERWAAQTYPAWISYDVVVTAIKDEKTTTNHYRGVFDTQSNRLHVTVQSQEERAHPVRPNGMSFCFGYNGAACDTAHDEHAAAAADAIGVPMVTPTYSFGIARPAAGPAQASSPGPFPLIAVVSGAARTYEITLAGETVAGTGRAYHLRLRPLREAGKNRLRELFVDESTYDVLSMRVSANFEQAPFDAVPWTITFARIGDAQFVSSEICDVPLRLWRGRSYDKVAIAFANVAAGSGRAPMDLALPEYALRALTEPGT